MKKLIWFSLSAYFLGLESPPVPDPFKDEDRQLRGRVKRGINLGGVVAYTRSRPQGRRLTYPAEPKGAWYFCADDRLSGAVVGLPLLLERVRHLFGHRIGVDLPDVLTLALSSPSKSVMGVLTGEGLGDLDLAAVAVLAVPLWALPPDQRSTVAALCEHP